MSEPLDNFDADGIEYEDVEFIDTSSEDELLATAVERMRVSIPEWVPDEAQTEMVLLEALCVLVGMTVYEINQLPELVVEQLLGLYGVTRDEGALARGVVEFTVSGSEPVQVVPVDTVVRWTSETTGETYDFVTVEELTLEASRSTTGRVSVECVEPGVIPNGIVGQPVSLVDSIPFVEFARFATVVSGGRDDETTEELLDRGAAVFARQNSTLVLPDQFATAALEHASVKRAKAYSRVDPKQPYREVLGHVTVVVAGNDNESLSEEVREQVERSLVEKAIAGLNVHVIEPHWVVVEIKATVVASPSSDAETVKKNVERVLRSYLSPSSWSWSNTIAKNELVGVASKATGVVWVKDVVLNQQGKPPVDVLTLSEVGFGAMPWVGKVTVEVVNND